MHGYHDRTIEYVGRLPDAGVGIAAGGDATETPAGQIAVLSVVNMIARIHPTVSIDLDDRALLVDVPGVKSAATVGEAAAELAVAARPDIVLCTAAANLDVPVLGLGGYCRANRYITARGWTGIVDADSNPWKAGRSDTIGLGVGASLGAAWASRRSLGLQVDDRRAVSLWTLEGTSSHTGPDELGSLDLDGIAMAGAGAVASGFAWWARCIGHRGDFVIVDGDYVEPGNLNRSLSFFVSDVDSPKSLVLAACMPGASSVFGWWDEYAHHLTASPRTVLALANDRGVRRQFGASGHPVVLHATTGRYWTAELHRHLLLETNDDCIACRFPDQAAPVFECATGELPPEHLKGNDAALPFLSGAAGLLLAASILQHQLGELRTHPANHWQLAFEPRRNTFEAMRHTCSATTCPAPSREVLRRLF